MRRCHHGQQRQQQQQCSETAAAVLCDTCLHICCQLTLETPNKCTGYINMSTHTKYITNLATNTPRFLGSASGPSRWGAAHLLQQRGCGSADHSAAPNCCSSAITLGPTICASASADRPSRLSASAESKSAWPSGPAGCLLATAAAACLLASPASLAESAACAAAATAATAAAHL
jgi:hypothetical protein